MSSGSRMTVYLQQASRLHNRFLTSWLRYVPKLSLHYVQGQEPEKGIREYFYYVDHQGMLFLDDARIKNFTSCFKVRKCKDKEEKGTGNGQNKRFLVFFFRQVKRNESGRYMVDFPFLSPCGKERNYIRGDDYPTVFTHLASKSSSSSSETEDHLCYGHTGDVLSVPFEPNKIFMAESGRVYHPAPEKAGKIGLVSSKLAIQLSQFFKFERSGAIPTHFDWAGTNYLLDTEWYNKAQDENRNFVEKAKLLEREANK